MRTMGWIGQSFLIALAVLAGAVPSAGAAAAYQQTNLVSNGSLPASNPPDGNLVNPWGIASSPTSPFWVANNGTGTSTLYNSAGQTQALVVTIPPSAGGTGTGTPTGVVYNPDRSAFDGSLFLFATEQGTVSGWTASDGTVAPRKVDSSGSGAVYKGIAYGTSAAGSLLYVANFAAGRIDVFNSTFAPATLSGSFLDPTLPSGYSPFNIQNLGGNLFVTYAKRDAATGDEIAGAGLGYIDEFDTNGVLIRRIASQGSLDAPWGLAVAPAGFGDLAGDLLVGNFGDGRILAYNISGTPTFDGSLKDSLGNEIVNPGLWGLIPGNGGNGGDLGKVYFTAGGAGEDQGLLGVLAPVPEPMTWLLLAAGGAGVLRRRRRDRMA